MATSHPWTELMWAEMADLGTLLHELPDEELDRPSLCDGWAVRDVVGHMLLGHTAPMGTMLGMVVRYRGNIDKGSAVESHEYVASLDAGEIRSRWDELVRTRTKRGIAKLIRPIEGFVDHTVHQQDIRRPLDRPRTIPEDRLVAALDASASVSGPMFAPAKRLRGLRVEATDVGWTHGSGPLVSGPGEAIVMAAAGRTAALADLEGDGVSVLTQRLG